MVMILITTTVIAFVCLTLTLLFSLPLPASLALLHEDRLRFALLLQSLTHSATGLGLPAVALAFGVVVHPRDDDWQGKAHEAGDDEHDDAGCLQGNPKGRYIHLERWIVQMIRPRLLSMSVLGAKKTSECLVVGIWLGR